MSSYATAFWNLVNLNLKSFAQQKFRIALLFFLIILLSFFAGAAGSFFLSSAVMTEPISVAIVDLDNSFETRMILSAVTESAEYGSLLEFSHHSATSAVKALQDGEVAAVFTLPENFGRGITTGENIPFTVTYNQDMPLLSALVRVSAEAFADMLRLSQMGVYVTLNYAALRELTPEHYDMIFMGVNMRFLSLVLGRGEIFVKDTLSVTGGLLIWHSYFIAAYIALMICCAYVMTDVLRLNYSRYFIISIKSRGISSNIVFIACICSYFLLFFLINLTLWLLSLSTASIFGLPPFALSLNLLLGVAAISAVLAAFAAMLTFVFGSALSAGIFTAVFAVLSLFLSGGIIPVEFFSKTLHLASNAVWSTWGVRLLSSAFLGEPMILPITISLLFGLIFSGVGCAAAAFKGRVL